MNVLIMYNPKAGRHKGHIHADKLERALERLGDMTVSIHATQSILGMKEFFEMYKMSRAELADLNDPSRFDRLVIIGGDGTVGPIVDSLVKHHIDIPIYCYGRGTANDFATFFKTNCGPRRAARMIKYSALLTDADKLKSRADNVAMVDTILVNGEHACNVACGGAFTNGVTAYHKKGKKLLGKFSYFFQAFLKSFRLESQTMRFTVDGKTFEEEIFLFYVLNTRNVGGLKNSSPLSDVQDGVLDLLCVKKCGFFGKMSLALYYTFGIMHRCPHIVHRQGKVFRIEHAPHEKVKHNFTLADIDGNPAGPYPLDVTIGPRIAIVHNNNKIASANK